MYEMVHEGPVIPHEGNKKKIFSSVEIHTYRDDALSVSFKILLKPIKK